MGEVFGSLIMDGERDVLILLRSVPHMRVQCAGCSRSLRLGGAACLSRPDLGRRVRGQQSRA